MIAPRPRLLLWFALLGLPSALIPALDPSLPTGWALAGPLLIGTVAFLDAALVVGGLKHVSLRMAPVTRCSRDRAAALALEIRSEAAAVRRVRVGLSLPASLRSFQEELWVHPPSDGIWGRVDWGFEPKERGQFHIKRARLGMRSRLGLWDHWISQPVEGEIRSYPNLALDKRPLAALFLNRGSLGLHAQRQVGQGREFEKLREYVPGDSYDEIHWKATAKRGQPVTKVFQLERTQEVYVFIDASRLSSRTVPRLGDPRKSGAESAREEPLLDRYLTAGLVLGQAAEHQGDLFGLGVFSDRVQTFIRAGSGSAHAHVCRDALYRLQCQSVSPDFDELGSFIRARLRRRALLLYLTSLDDPIHAETFLRHAKLLSRQHLMVVMMARPHGVAPLFSGDVPATSDGVYEKLGAHLRWQSLQEHGRQLEKLGVAFQLVEPGSLGLELVTRYMRVKNRQML